MLGSRRPLLTGLVLAAGLTIGTHAAPVAAQSASLFPAGVMTVPVAGVADVVMPPIIVPPIGIGAPHRANVTKERSRTERADITIGGA